MVNKTLAIVMALFIQVAGANEQNSTALIKFTGQNQESLSLQNKLTETRYRTEYRDSTCYREVPYQETVCETIPDYDTVCETIPGRQDCRTEYDRQCRYETRYRRDCHRTPDRQRCSNETRYRKECERGPSRRECHMDNSNRVCRQEPAREQCRTTSSGERRCRTIPGRRICENKPEQVCRTVPGEMQCRKVPYTERVCHTIPGEQQCRDIPYQDEVCEDVPRQQCEWIPSRQDCREVQIGSHQECREETRYRTESYACKEPVQIPYTVTLKTFNLRGNINFEVEAGYEPQFTLAAKLTEEGHMDFKISETNDFSPMSWIKKSEQRSGTNEVEIEGEYSLKIKNAKAVKAATSTISEVKLTKESLSFSLGDHEDIDGHEVFLTLTDGETKLIARKLGPSEFVVVKKGSKLFYNVSMKKLGLKLKNLHKYGFKLGTSPTFKEELAFPSVNFFRVKKEGSLYTFNENDLNRLKQELDKLSHLDMSSEKLVFRFPNHKLISDATPSLKIGDLFDRELTKDEFSWQILDDYVDVTVSFEKLGLELDLTKKVPVKVGIKYFFEQEAPLPNDFTFSAELQKDIQPEVGKALIREAKQASRFLESIELYKYSMNFKLKKSELLEGFDLTLLISKKGKEKINKVFSSTELDVKEEGDFLIVDINFKDFDGKVSRWGKHAVNLKIEHKVKEGLRVENLGSLGHQKTVQLKAK